MVSRIYCARRCVSSRLFFGSSHNVFWRFIFPVNNVAYNASYSPLRYIICEMIWIIPNGPGARRVSYGDGTRLIQVPIASVSLGLAFLYIVFWISVQVVILTCLTWGQLNCFFVGEKKKSFFSLSVTIRWCANTKLCVTVACYFKNYPSFLTLQHAHFSGIQLKI